VEDVEEKDVVKGDLVELGADKKEKEDGVKVEAAVLCPAYIKDAKQKKAFIGAKIGDTVKINPKKAFENEAEIASLLKIDKSAVENVEGDFQITISGITRYKESELDQTLFDKVFGEGVVSNEEEFRAKIKESIQENLDADSDYKFSLDARDAVINKLDKLAFPDAFLKRWVLATNENMTEEALVNDYELMIRDLKWHLAKDKLAKENNIKVETEDIDAFGKRIAKAQFAQYGMPNVPDDILDNYVKDMYKDEKSLKNIVESVVNDKVVKIVKDSVKLETTKISIDDFNKMLETK
jgi:trigger factor